MGKKHNKKLIFKMIDFVVPSKKLLAISFVLSFINVAATLLGPLLVGFAINFVVGEGNVDFNSLYKYALLIAAVYIISAVSAYFVAYLNNLLTQKTIKNIRDKLLNKFQKLPLKFVDQNLRGDLINRVINDVETIGEGVLQGFTQFFTGILSIIGIIVFMMTINVYISLAVIFITPLSIFIAIFITKKTQKYFKSQQAFAGQLNGHSEEMITAQKMLIGFNYQDYSQNRFNVINENLKKTSMSANLYSSLINPTTRFVNNIVYVVAGMLGLYLGLSVGSIASFLMYSSQYARPFNEITNVLSQLQSALASASRVFEVLESEEEALEGSENIADCKGNVDFCNVYFSYTPDVPLIENFNLKVESGKKIAIVGPTGSGKTTLVNLLMRFYETTSGKITIDGKDIKTLTRKSLRNCFGMVLQDTWLIGGSIKDNIAYGKPNASLEDIVRVSKLAHCHEFIINMKDGYDTLVSENGGLSEGQKQLICIARVMLSDSPMLILDEATSNIDSRTEMYIQKAFDYLMEGKTSFVIAHRLSTIIKSDLILVLNNGNIIEQGTHDELLKQDGAYAKLYNSQFALR